MPRRPRTIYLLTRVNSALRSLIDARLRDVQMTGIQYTVLSVVQDHEGISSAELSRRFFVAAQSMNEIIAVLEQRALIIRKVDPENKRILRMKLTARGRKVLNQCDDIADAIEATAFDWMTAAELEKLRETMRALMRSLRDRGLIAPTPASVKKQSAS